MILNVSGRTDIVAFYSNWFFNRYQAGFVDVRNPFYPKMISRIYFHDVDAILFCTKNPIPILNNLAKITQPILFHVTLTPYQEDIEPYVPSKKVLIAAIKKLSNKIGKDHLFIRYDPIFLSKKYSLSYHKKAFERMCLLLNGYVEHIIISFLDNYKNVQKNAHILNARNFSEKDYKEIGTFFSKTAKQYGMTVQTCFEDHNLAEYGFEKNDCLSQQLAYQLTGKTYKKWKARKGKKCQCVEMVDIGVYNSCKHFCKYCYANFNEDQVAQNVSKHDPTSSLLIGHIHPEDTIKIRKK